MLPDGIRPAAILIREGRIEAVVDHRERPSGVVEIDAGEHAVLPGIVDTHVHINDPGRAGWEGFEHATRAAAAGGVTTLVDMPLNSIPATTTVAGLFAKRVAADDRCFVDVAFWGGVVPGNAGELAGLAQAGVRGFKCFLSPSGVDEFEHVGEDDLRAAMPIVASLDLPLLAHAEWPPLLVEPPADADPRRYETWLASRPPASEHTAIELLGRLAAEFRTRVHIVHLASAGGLPVLRAARAAGARVTVETCPHYLTFAAEDISDGATPLKCAPPIRSAENRGALWNALIGGEIDLVATDHSPSPPAMKHLDDGDFVKGVGRHRLAANRVRGHVDRRRGERRAARPDGKVVLGGAGAAGGPGCSQGVDRAWPGCGPGHPRSRCGIRGRSARPAAPARHHPVCGPNAAGPST